MDIVKNCLTGNVAGYDVSASGLLFASLLWMKTRRLVETSAPAAFPVQRFFVASSLHLMSTSFLFGGHGHYDNYSRRTSALTSLADQYLYEAFLEERWNSAVEFTCMQRLS